MANPKLDFDYEGVLETVALQKENVEDIVVQTDNYEAIYWEKYRASMKLEEQIMENNKRLEEAKRKVRETMSRISSITSHKVGFDSLIKSEQEKIARDYIEHQNIMGSFAKKTLEVDKCFKEIEARSEESSIEQRIRDVRAETSKVNQEVNELQVYLDGLKNEKIVDERLPNIQLLAQEFAKGIGDIEEVKKRVAEKKKKIEFLKNEIKKLDEEFESLK